MPGASLDAELGPLCRRPLTVPVVRLKHSTTYCPILLSTERPPTTYEGGFPGKVAHCAIVGIQVVSTPVVSEVHRMGRSCVPNCRGNYDGGPKVRLFSFPKDHCRTKWKRAICREDVDIDTLRDPKVCELHFKAEYLRTTTTHTDSNGRTIEVPMSLTRLTEDAVPRMFPNSPAYLSDCAPVREEPDSKRKRREADQLQKVIQMSLSSHEEDERKNRVASFEQLVSQLSELKLSDYWLVGSTEASIMFLHIQSNTLPPEVERSVVVSNALHISAYWKKMKLYIADVPIPEKLEDIRSLQTILESVEHFNAPDVCEKEEKLKACFHIIFSLLDDLSYGDLLPEEKLEALEFLKEQLRLLLKERGAVQVKKATFETLRELYASEQHNLSKLGYGLTYKALNPSNLERQNVKLALKVMSPFIAEALKTYGAKLGLSSARETAEFIELIHKWWCVVNTKTPSKGKRIRNPLQAPVRSMEDMQLQFLNTFVDWLDTWENLKVGTGRAGLLTTETHSALRLTSYSLIEVSRYCLEELRFEYVLLGKFQTDSLEERFGRYRRLCGSNYHISVQQIFESEAKLRLQNSLVFPDMKELSQPSSTVFDAAKVIEEYGIKVTEEDVKSKEESLPAIVYIAGYCAHAALRKIPCEDCAANITRRDRDMPMGDDMLIEGLTRGALKFPQPVVISAVLHTQLVLEKLTSKENIARFHSARHQRQLLLSVVKHLLIDNEDLDTCCKGHHPDTVLHNILWAASQHLTEKLRPNENRQVNGGKEGCSTEEKTEDA
ncbi:hypothetical protein HPB50_014795 [Hyalomma asiaticum]|uniref:Uncharacterized protein n=1 Tax=Hyalomma asiaticum TaxID=266040 RepID=A0ACB7SH71_HYAAI|nr:hypothetical protein HPB50_014795 [Hyalomma asiaticum]